MYNNYTYIFILFNVIKNESYLLQYIHICFNINNIYYTRYTIMMILPIQITTLVILLIII